MHNYIFNNKYITNLQDDETEYWEYDKITVERGSGGLGFSIAGGVDSESLVLVTRVSPDIGPTGLRANDIILRVNDQSLEHVPHSFAVAALKNAGDIVSLVCFILLIITSYFVNSVFEVLNKI